MGFFLPLVRVLNNLSTNYDGNVRGFYKGKLAHERFGVYYKTRRPVFFFAPIFWSALGVAIFRNSERILFMPFTLPSVQAESEGRSETCYPRSSLSHTDMFACLVDLAASDGTV